MAKVVWQWWIFGLGLARFAVAAGFETRKAQVRMGARRHAPTFSRRCGENPNGWAYGGTLLPPPVLGCEQLRLAGQLVLGAPADGVIHARATAPKKQSAVALVPLLAGLHRVRFRRLSVR